MEGREERVRMTSTFQAKQASVCPSNEILEKSASAKKWEAWEGKHFVWFQFINVNWIFFIWFDDFRERWKILYFTRQEYTYGECMSILEMNSNEVYWSSSSSSSFSSSSLFSPAHWEERRFRWAACSGVYSTLFGGVNSSLKLISTLIQGSSNLILSRLGFDFHFDIYGGCLSGRLRVIRLSYHCRDRLFFRGFGCSGATESFLFF